MEERQFSRFISLTSTRGFLSPLTKAKCLEVPKVSSALVALSRFSFTETGIVSPDRKYSPQT